MVEVQDAVGGVVVDVMVAVVCGKARICGLVV